MYRCSYELTHLPNQPSCYLAVCLSVCVVLHANTTKTFRLLGSKNLVGAYFDTNPLKSLQMLQGPY